LTVQGPQGWLSTSLEIKGIPQIEQKGGSIHWISERQAGQIPCRPSSKYFPQQWHSGGRKNWKSLSIKGGIHHSFKMIFSSNEAELSPLKKRRGGNLTSNGLSKVG
jgi:hypothetical protein